MLLWCHKETLLFYLFEYKDFKMLTNPYSRSRFLRYPVKYQNIKYGNSLSKEKYILIKLTLKFSVKNNLFEEPSPPPYSI